MVQKQEIKSNRKEANELQSQVYGRLNSLSGDHVRIISDELRAELFQMLDRGNKELLSPNGITPDTDLNPVRTCIQRLADRVLLYRSVLYSRTRLAEDRSTHKYVSEVRRIVNNQFGVVLFEDNWSKEIERPTRRWIYPARGDEPLNS